MEIEIRFNNTENGEIFEITREFEESDTDDAIEEFCNNNGVEYSPQVMANITIEYRG